MKGKAITFLAVAATLLLQASPGSAANPYGSGERQTWPKWYYYDQVGLRMWHKGDKNGALNMFDQSYKLAESQLQGKRALDTRTKSMVRDVVNHQLFHMNVWRQPNETQSRTATLQELVTKTAQVSKSERERELRWIERLEAFAKRNLGPKHLDVQALEKHRQFLAPPDPNPGEDDLVNTQGKANHGTVIRPKWYQTNERDFTPELFTRNPRKVHQEGTEDQKRMDVTKRPTEQVQKGFSYVAGKKIDMSKPKQPSDSRSWAGSSTVGSIEVNNPNQKPSGWGADQKDTNYGAGKTRDQTQWGIGGQAMSQGGKKVNSSSWGSSAEDQDNIFNKPWGGAGQSNQSDQQQTGDNKQ
jgi:hypothetical protein